LLANRGCQPALIGLTQSVRQQAGSYSGSAQAQQAESMRRMKQ